MSLVPTYEAIKRETSGKPAGNLYWGKNLLSFWALDNRVRMVYCHQSTSIIFLREYWDVFNIHLWRILCLLLTEWFLVSYLLSLSVGLDSRIVVFWSLMCFFDTVVLLSGLYPFSSLNPDCGICITWDSPWYLVSISGWYHHVWCILYTNNVVPGMLCVY